MKLPKFYVYHLAKVQQFYIDKLNIPASKFRFRELSEAERSFYNKIHFDVELNLETLGGFKEVAGVHYRETHDLGGHQKGSGEKLEVLVEGKRILPVVLELSFGVDRNIWALLDIFFKQEKERNLFAFPAAIAPLNLAVFPLVNKDGLPEKAKKIHEVLRKEFITTLDVKASIGRLYRRVDEIGCPLAITIDYQTLKDDTVTIRFIKDMNQTRVKISELKEKIRNELIKN
ncbi:MAG: His/Gly/Thr/Pro-type tRNA ligase C-terminal domain-containing protein [Nanoarchaeota archaeon]